MEQTRLSDLDTTMLAKNAFDEILEMIKTSNLNFQMNLSPFSASISLKKSLIRGKFGIVLALTPVNPASQKEFSIYYENAELVKKNEHLSQKILEIENFVTSKTQTIQVLEAKLANTEASALKTFNEKNDEDPEKSIKNANMETT